MKPPSSTEQNCNMIDGVPNTPILPTPPELDANR
ncbi:DUF4316 domain-containing protein [Neglectibacter timonensis]